MTNQMRTLTVGELRELLSECPDDAKVLLSTSAGDYWGTTVGLTVDNAEDGTVVWSEYHRKWKVVDREEWELSGEEEVPIDVVLLT